MSKPDESILFEPVADAYGSRLALVFGNEFAKGECPFYTAKQCNHCDIGAGEGEQFDSEMNAERLGFFQEQYKDILQGIEHLVIYNSGSTLNNREMSRETLGNVLDYASSLEDCKVVSLDSREMYVTEDSLDYVVDKLREDQEARVILGVESQSDEVRIGKLNKRMTKQGIERAFSVASKYDGKVGVDVNIVFQPPELVGEEAIQESVETLKYGLSLGEQYGVSVDFNFHPYYQSEKSKGMFPDHSRADLQNAKEALRRMKAEIGKRDAKIFIGWQDEEHDQQSALRDRELEEEIVVLDRFNVTQDIQYLD
ncbi:MAG: hypothetical protein QF460_02715 [Candidatus Nanoarchaeia archaeon]|jgi:hypothetical protein|nr:hypothetical protein [Candidatus Nanoarchaeia archaeon]|tara:strand:+ start:3743 stop:4675 length:933 start_codon:yes stop_codon:yes gene_type:complete